MSETEDLRMAIARVLAGYTWQSDKAADAVLALPQVAELREAVERVEALYDNGDGGVWIKGTKVVRISERRPDLGATVTSSFLRVEDVRAALASDPTTHESEGR